MEQSSVPISTFESISLRGSTSVISIFLLIKDFLANTTISAKFCMGWVIFASLYALFFQTLLSALTGYVGTSK
jgi:putative Ca2+/H+ antiporter (TMEM165/GDT1 family)